MKGEAKAPKSYAAATSELKEILASLEEGELDVDQIAEKVKRAYALIQFCKERIGKAEIEITRVEEAFRKGDAAAEAAGESPRDLLQELEEDS